MSGEGRRGSGLTLGIESSCDETAAAVVGVADGGGHRVLSNVVAGQYEIHAEYAGVVPELASRAHVEAILPVVREALAGAGVGLGMIDLIAVGHRPGLIGPLLVGVTAAKALSLTLGRPLVGVDHVRAHLYSGVMGEASTENVFPALGLVVSGGHTALFVVESWSRIRRLGSTIDDAVGEAFDKAATILGLPHPGGPNLDRLASSPGANDRAHEFPVSRLSRESLDFSFSGLKTAILYAVNGVPGPRGAPALPMTEPRRADLAASFRRAAVDAIMLKLDRAAERIGLASGGLVLTGGGVTANSLLRRRLTEWGRATGRDVRLPALSLCMDNAAMIAGLGAALYAAGRTDGMDLQADPSALTDDEVGV